MRLFLKFCVNGKILDSSSTMLSGTVIFFNPYVCVISYRCCD